MEYATRERFGGLDLKTIGGGFMGLGLKTRAEVSRRNGWHVAASGSSHRGEATGEEARWPSDEDDTRLDLYALGLKGLAHLYQGQNWDYVADCPRLAVCAVAIRFSPVRFPI
jgi:hypothetical protein